MRSANLESRIAVERSVENQMREEDGGFERIADHVVQPSVACETPVQFGNTRGIPELEGMHENQHAQLLGFGPEGVELAIGQLITVDMAGDRRATQPQLLHAFLQLLRRQVGKLQRHGSEGYEPVRVRGT